MARNYISSGDVIDVVLAAAATSGVPIALGNHIAVPLMTTPAGAIAALKVVGVWDLPKTTGQAYTVGQRVNFRAGLLTTATPAVAGDLNGAAMVLDAAAAGATVARVRLLPGVATVT